MATYAVFFNRKRIELEADSLYAAKRQGVAHFKPRKSQEHMVTPVLIAKDGAAVTVTLD